MKTGRVPFPMWLLLLLFPLAACDDGVKAVDNCGDGFLDPGEQCDGADLGGADCTVGDYYEGTLGCRADCTYDFSACTGRCGDNQLDPAETCEGGELRDQTCQSLGFQSGQLTCTDTCEYDTTSCVGACGDGMKDLNEGCDDGDQEAGDGCSPGCTVEAGWSCAGNPSWCEPVCGDDLIAGDEPCDGEALDGATCESRGYYGGELACAADCASFDESGCQGSCGDGFIQTEEGEECDGTNLNGQTCLSQGMSGDGLACDATCRLDTTACVIWTEVSVGAPFACAIDAAGDVWCWGSNLEGQCGQSPAGGRFTTPVRVPDLPHPAVAISTGYHHACAILEEPGTQLRSLRCWGHNLFGQLGRTIETPYAQPTPEDVPGMEGVEAVSAGNNFTCALIQGNLWCWGANDTCQLGRGDASMDPDPTPVKVTLGPSTTLTHLSCGYMFCAARRNDGQVATWGSHTNGKLGIATAQPVCSPTLPTNFGNLQYPFAGGEHACALDTQGVPSCWGYNLNGALGDGTNIDRTQPSPVVSTGVLYDTMDLGAGHSCALDFNGAVWCWGTNTSGENGTGDSVTVFSRNSPARIESLTRPVVRLSAGYESTCAILEGGALSCWGQNMEGQLGTGDTLSRDVPTPVVAP